MWMLVFLILLLNCVLSFKISCYTNHVSPKLYSNDLEDDLFGLDGTGTASENDLESSQIKGTGVGKLLENALILLGKAPTSKLHSLLTTSIENNKENENLILNVDLPTDENDHNAYVEVTLDALWQSTNGDWEKFNDILLKELKPIADEASEWMKQSAAAGNLLSETKIKSLLNNFGPEYMPKMRHNRGEGRKYEGKLLKGDYLAALLDVVRAKNGNDYQKVYEYMKEKSDKSASNKGFGA